MRVSALTIPDRFKRFGSLEIGSIGADVDLVVMLGPNGSGKSSVFDAFLQWARSEGRRFRRGVSNDYFDFETGHFGTPEVTLHPTDPHGSAEPLGPMVHVRTAHRNTPDVMADSVQKQEDFRSRRNALERMTETDASLSEHFHRLVAKLLPTLSRLEPDDADSDLRNARRELEPLRKSLTRVFPYLRLEALWDDSLGGSFYFERDDGRRFQYEHLSGGEKAVFDLLLDVHIAATELGQPLICVDEPELHLNPAAHGPVLTELMELLPAGSQLWIATHSIGMIRKAFQISAEDPGRVAFLDFGQVEGALPDVRLSPSRPSRQLLREAMAVALDDLAHLLAPEILIICEGSEESTRKPLWDERIYRQVFHDLYQRVEFKSSGGKSDLGRAAAMAAVIAPGTRLLRLRDGDDLPPEHRLRLLEDEPDLRVLKRYSLESYLLDDEVLEALVGDRDSLSDDALAELKAVRDEARLPSGSEKASLGAVFETAKRSLRNAEQLGENAYQFAVDVLAPLITAEMEVREELLDETGLRDTLSPRLPPGAPRP